MALHKKKKRYKATTFKVRTNNGRIWKVIVCIVIGIAISLAVFFTGLHLNESMPYNTGDGMETTAPETEKNNIPTFQFKDVAEFFAADKKVMSLFHGEQNALDTVMISVSEADGKLRYRSAALNILSGAGEQKNLPTLEALVQAESVEEKRVSLFYTPFSLEEDTSLVINCIRLVIGEMSTFGADEIIIDARGLTRAQIEIVASVLPQKSNVHIGLLLSKDVLEQKNAESVIRNYYELYDMLIFDLSTLPSDAPETSTGTGETETGESTAVKTLESFLKENQLILAKYSVRIHAAAKNVQDAERIIALADLYETCGVSLVSE